VREVAPEAFAVVRALSERLTVPLDQVCAGVVTPEEAERDGLSWDAFCALLDRLQARCGSLGRLRSEAACALAVPQLGAALVILRSVAGVRGLMWANFRWGGPKLFPMVKTSFQVLPDGRYLGTITVPAPHRHSDAYFHLCAGLFSAFPRALDLPDAEVEVNACGGRGEFLITPPASQTIWSRIAWWFQALFSSRTVIDELAAQNERLTIESREAQAARKVAEEARQVAERARAEAVEALRLKSDFINTMSHELRTPLNGILGMTRFLLKSSLDADQRDFSQTILSSGTVLLQLINDILDFAKLDAGQLVLDPTPVALRELVTEVIQAAQTRVGSRPVDVVAMVAADVPPFVLVDGLRLRQVITNLVDNAVKFTERGEVRVSIRTVPGEAGRLRLEVADDGVGIEAGKLESIFQPFVQADGSTTRKYGGTGLGLTISARLASALGDGLRVQSEVGKGSCFGFAFSVGAALPAVPEVAPPVTSRAVAVYGSPALRESLASWLGSAGFAVGDEPADLVIVDGDATGAIALPEGARVVRLSRTPERSPGSLRKPVRREELLAALQRSASGDERLRVRVMEDEPPPAPPPRPRGGAAGAPIRGRGPGRRGAPRGAGRRGRARGGWRAGGRARGAGALRLGWGADRAGGRGARGGGAAQPRRAARGAQRRGPAGLSAAAAARGSLPTPTSPVWVPLRLPASGQL
jgi:signal transduction histidine kinase